MDLNTYLHGRSSKYTFLVKVYSNTAVGNPELVIQNNERSVKRDQNRGKYKVNAFILMYYQIRILIFQPDQLIFFFKFK